MDIWKFYDITHSELVVCNPISEEKLGRLVDLLRLPTDSRVVDIGCGKGEFLIRLAEAYGARCVGVDLSPHFIAAARERVRARAQGENVTLVEVDGAEFRAEEPHSVQVASCIGASWVFGGYPGTLEALVSMVEPGGWVVAGEPYWVQEPCEEYIEASGGGLEGIGTHVSNVEMANQRGLDLVHTLVSSKDDWDRYEGFQWYAASEYARAHPEDPDVAELIERMEKAKTLYLRWGRETLSWAIYVFRRRTILDDRD